MVWEDAADEHVGLKCLAGCSRKAIVEAMGLSEQDLYRQDTLRVLHPVQPGVTLIDLAVDKLINPHLLAHLGMADCTHRGQQAVRIPYYRQDGSQYPRYRIRTALVAKEGSAWSRGAEPLIPYGLHRLEDAHQAGYLVIAEGESDCWTLWQHKLPALGLPGVTAYNTLMLDHLSGIERVYVVQEPDKAGRELPTNVYKRLQQVGYTGKVYALNLMEEAGAKDPNELQKRGVKQFKGAFQTALLRARPLFS